MSLVIHFLNTSLRLLPLAPGGIWHPAQQDSRKAGEGVRGSLWERTGEASGSQGDQLQRRTELTPENLILSDNPCSGLPAKPLCAGCPKHADPILRCHRCLHPAFAANSQIASYSCPLHCPFQKVKIENKNVLQECLNRMSPDGKDLEYSTSQYTKICVPVYV